MKIIGKIQIIHSLNAKKGVIWGGVCDIINEHLMGDCCLSVLRLDFYGTDSLVRNLRLCG